MVPHRPPVDSPKLTLTQTALVELDGPHNKTETQESEKGTGREEERLAEMREREIKDGEENNQNASYTRKEFPHNLINKNIFPMCLCYP